MRWTLQAGHLTWAISETVWVFVVATICWPLRTIFPCCYVVEWWCPSLCLILWNDGSDICTGKYLATKWRYERTRLFHCLAVMLLVLVVAGFLVTAIVSGATLKAQTHLGTGIAKSIPNFASWFDIWFGMFGPLSPCILSNENRSHWTLRFYTPNTPFLERCGDDQMWNLLDVWKSHAILVEEFACKGYQFR